METHNAAHGSQLRRDRPCLCQIEGGEKVAAVCRRLGINEQTLYRLKKQIAGLGVAEVRELHENAKLKQIVADLTRDRHSLQEIVRKEL